MGLPCIKDLPEGHVAGTRSAQPARVLRRDRERVRAERDIVSPRYNWVVLSNTTLGVLIADDFLPDANLVGDGA